MVPPNDSTASITRATASPTISFSSSGSRRSPSAVEPDEVGEDRRDHASLFTDLARIVRRRHAPILPDPSGFRRPASSASAIASSSIGSVDPAGGPATPPGARTDRGSLRGARPPPRRSCRCRRRARPRTGARARTPALGRHLQREPRREQREPHVGTVDRPRAPRRLDQVLQLLAALAVRDRASPRRRPRGRRVSPRTSAATASVTARQAVRQRSSQCVTARERGRELEQLVRPERVRHAERRAVHHGPVAGAHLGSALLDVLAGGVRGTLGRARRARSA